MPQFSAVSLLTDEPPFGVLRSLCGIVLCTARYGKMDFCTLLYVLYAFFHVLSKYFGSCRRLFLYFAVKHLTENTSVERISGMELKTAVQSVRRVQQI